MTKYFFILFIIYSCTYSNSDEKIGELSTESVKQDIKKLNKSMPYMVDEYTRIDEVKLVGKNIHYKHSLVKWKKKQIRKSVIINHDNTNLISKNCNNKYTLMLLTNNYIINYNYYDLNDEPVTIIKISKSDCTNINTDKKYN